MALIAHPVPGKEKARIICEAFIQGAPKDAEGDVFFGVNHGNIAPYLRAKALDRPWYYIDNAYFDKCRGTYFRVAKCALQCRGDEPSDGKRFAARGIDIKPWRKTHGKTILICSQNDNFMAAAVGYKGNWPKDTFRALEKMKLPYKLRIRPWSPDKAKLAIALVDELPKIHMVITHSSAAAITAMLEGVPAISVGGTARLLTGPLTREAIVEPRYPDGREAFAAALADNQWTLDEIRSGMAWEHLSKTK